ncbi:DNA methyltransferase [Helicobacter pylori]|uniref:DNA methyltransferase n=1 Tax=Helicobacter pylori TaxID=210 RepID=UPI000BE841CB
MDKDEFNKLHEDNRIYYGKDGNGIPQIKIFLQEMREVTPKSIFENLGSLYDAKEYELGKMFDKETIKDMTPKPEALLQRILEISTKENDLVCDFFAGSGTTCAVAHKLKRKYIGIEMGEHFESVILPRLKKVIGGFKSGALKEFNGGGAIKVYELESYEEILRKIKYEDNDKPLAYDEQYSDLVECKNESYTLNVEALEKMGVDIKETLENLWGVGVEFFNEKVVKFKGNDKEVEILKALKEALIW